MKSKFQKNWGMYALQGAAPSCANAMEAIGTSMINATLKDNPEAQKLFELAKEVLAELPDAWLSGTIMLLITGKGLREIPHDIDIIVPQHLFDDANVPEEWLEVEESKYQEDDVTIRTFQHDIATVKGLPVLLNIIQAEPQQHSMMWGNTPIAEIQDLVDAKIKYCLSVINPTKIQGAGIMVYKHMKDLVAIKQQNPHVQVLEKLNAPRLSSKEERFAFYFMEMMDTLQGTKG